MRINTLEMVRGCSNETEVRVKHFISGSIRSIGIIGITGDRTLARLTVGMQISSAYFFWWNACDWLDCC